MLSKGRRKHGSILQPAMHTEYGNSIMQSISVVIPVYNAESSLRELHRELAAVLQKITDRYEIIMVEDCGKDGSWDIIQELAVSDSRLRGIHLSRNYGQHNAVLCGIRAARMDTIVTMDDDLQHPPTEIPVLLKKLEEGYDVVYGVPAQEQHGLWRDFASRVSKVVLQGAMGAETARKVSAFRALRARLREAFSDYRGTFVSIDVLLTWGTTRFSAVTVKHHARRYGVSNYSIRQLMTHALNMMTGFSTLPLQFASMVGFVFTLFGVGILVYVVGRYFFQGSVVPGFPFLAAIIAIFSGAQLFALGIVGEYLARIHFRSMARPSYTIQSQTNSPGETTNGSSS